MSWQGATKQARERRAERRIAVQLPLQVRDTDHDGLGFEEATTTKNVCRTGAAFATVHQLDLGADLEMTISRSQPGGEAETDFTTRGRVLHIEPGRNNRERIVGVAFIGPRFHRIFTPESTAQQDRF